MSRALSGNHSTGKITASGSYAGGLFGCIECYLWVQHEIEDSYSLGDVEALSGSYAGGFAGDIIIFYADTSLTIRDCYAKSRVSAESYAGGFVGEVLADRGAITINDCYATGNVTASTVYSYAGGFIGSLYARLGSGSITVSDCYSQGDVSGDGAIGGWTGSIDTQDTCTIDISLCHSIGRVVNSNSDRAGGWVGYIDDNSGGVTVAKCFSTGNVEGGNGNWVGGFAGEIDAHSVSKCFSRGNASSTADWVAGFAGQFKGGSLTDCYSRGSAEGNDYVASFVGQMWGNLANCYATGKVVGADTDVGGLVAFWSAGVVSNSFWDKDASGQSSSAGGDGKTTINLKQRQLFTDAGWDFVATWAISPVCNYGYPALRGVTPGACDVANPILEKLVFQGAET